MVITVPCLNDNYAYLIEDGDGGAAVVDPSEPGPVQRALAHRGLVLRQIWNTHHHWDHVGGNEELASDETIVICSHHDQARVPVASKFVGAGDELTFGPYRVRILSVPGHTLGAIAFVLEEAGVVRAVFTGDTLFAAGCGRLFEGTPAMMHDSLQQLMQLPASTHVFCGHEYTAKNLEFARSLEPSNPAIATAIERVAELRGRGLPSVPSTIGDELAINPFVRTDAPELRTAVGLGPEASAADVLGAVRARKDNYK